MLRRRARALARWSLVAGDLHIKQPHPTNADGFANAAATASRHPGSTHAKRRLLHRCHPLRANG
ncbi:MAG: hypothetical protein J7L99_05885 [Planctomycetes bacterium]|nr:hypothetical protein [Planctomycetota bacterium]